MLRDWARNAGRHFPEAFPENFLPVRELANPEKLAQKFAIWTVYGDTIHDNDHDHEAIFV